MRSKKSGIEEKITKNRAEWSIKEAVSIFVLLGVVEVTFSFLHSLKPLSGILVILVARLIDLLIISGYIRFVRRQGLSLIGISPSDYRQGIRIGVSVCLLFGMIVLLLEVVYYLIFSQDLFKMLVVPGFSRLLTDRFYLLFYLLTVSVIAPLVEEILFRAILYNALRARMSFATAMFINALIFVIAHGPSGSGLIIPLVGGIIFCLLYERTGSIIAPLIVHSAGNSIITMVGFFI